MAQKPRAGASPIMLPSQHPQPRGSSNLIAEEFLQSCFSSPLPSLELGGWG